jgi:UDP-N-acetylmuramoyl-L-alanyl-D-glutamate--2,6-diaminopimelate ligase
MKLDTLLRDVRHLSATGPRDRDVTGVACDSRQVRQGFVFVAVDGTEKDGRLFVKDAVGHGAIAVVSKDEVDTGRDICRVRVEDARLAVAELSCAFFNRPADRLQMIGVTGTNGKTTTVYMVGNILRAAGLKTGLITTVEYQIGERVIPASRTTPEAPALQSMLAQVVGAGCRSLAMEVSSHALSQKRTAGIDFDAAVFTNLTQDHLDYHQTMESYFDAKKLLFSDLGRKKKQAAAVINVDDPCGERLSGWNEIRANVLTYGMGTNAKIRAEDIKLSASGSSFLAVTPWGTTRIELALLGRFNISNALAATACCGSMGIKLDVIAKALSNVTSVPGRLENIPTKKGFQVFVDYAHTDDALGHVLKTLREIVKGRIILVFGCGGNRDRTKRQLMGQVASHLADYSVVTSDNPRKENPSDIIAQIKEGFGGSQAFEIIEDRAEAIKRAVNMAADGDVVLIAGKGHENFQEFANMSVSFDDRQVVRRYL